MDFLFAKCAHIVLFVEREEVWRIRFSTELHDYDIYFHCLLGNRIANIS